MLKSAGNPQAGRGIQFVLSASTGRTYRLDIFNGYNNGAPTDQTSISITYDNGVNVYDLITTSYTPNRDQVYLVRAVRQNGSWTLYVDGATIGAAADPLSTTNFTDVQIITVGSVMVDDLAVYTSPPAPPTCYTLTKTANPSGGGSVSADPAPNCNNGTQYTSGAVVQLTGNANAGYTFTNWSGDAAGSTTPVAVTMTGNKSVTANFVGLPSVPLLLLPANGSLTTNYTPMLDWSNTTATAFYQVQIATNNTFTSVVQDVSNLTDSNYTASPALAPNTTYYWRARAFNVLAQSSAWSAVWSFRTALTPPTLISPNDGETLLTMRPAFDWSDVPGAASYTLQVSPSSTFAPLTLNAVVIPSTYTMVADLPRGLTLYWRVLANGLNGPNASLTRSFISANPPSVPVLVSPLNGSLTADYTPLLNWNDSTLSPDHYELQVATNNTFTAIVVNETNISLSEFTPATDLAPNTTHYWRVRAVNALNQASAWSAIFSFRTALTPPTLISPNNGETILTMRPTFDWNDVPGAASYTLQVSPSSTFAPLTLNAVVIPSTYTMVADLPRGLTLYWRVLANGLNGPNASLTRSFISANPPSVPVLVSPPNGSLTTDYTPRLDWSTSTVPVGTAFGHYQVQVATDVAFTALVIDDTVPDLLFSEYTPATDLDPNTKHYWRVRAFNTDGQYSLWSATFNFRTAILPPTLLSPDDGITQDTTRPAFDWNDMSGATNYTIQIAITSTFATPTVNAMVVPSTYTATVDLPRNKLTYWRVRSNGVNGPSAWSEVRTFTSANPPSVPILAAPANGALTTDYTPRLDWSTSTVPVGSAFGHYQVQVATDAAFTALVIDDTVPDLLFSEYTPATDLDPNTKHYWRVRAFNTGGQYSLWSATFNFRTALLPPTLLSPNEGKTLLTMRPIFDWDIVDGATSYALQVSTSPAFAVLTVNAVVSPSAYTMTVDLPKNNLIYWRVRSNGVNGPSAWSEVRSFTSANPPSVPVLLSPANGATVTSTPTLTWSASTVPVGTTLDHYEVQIATSNTFSVIEQQNNTGTINSYTAAALGSGIHYWRVRAFNTAGQYSNWSVVRSFRVP